MISLKLSAFLYLLLSTFGERACAPYRYITVLYLIIDLISERAVRYSFAGTDAFDARKEAIRRI